MLAEESELLGLHMENFQKWQMHLVTTLIDEQWSAQKANQIKLKKKRQAEQIQCCPQASRQNLHTSRLEVALLRL